MIVEKIAASTKKSLAVTLALALGLSLPGGAWSQVMNGRVAPVAAIGAESAASFAGAMSIQTNMAPLSVSAVPSASLTVPQISAAMSAPSAAAAAPAASPVALAAPLAAPAAASAAVDAHPVIGLINQLQKAGVALPETLSSRADAAKIEQAALALPEGSPVRAQLGQLASSIRAAASDAPRGEGAGDLGKTFDGSKSQSASAAPVKAGAFRRLLNRLLPHSVAKAVGARQETAAPQPEDPKKYELSVNEVRYAPVAEKLPATTQDIKAGAKTVVGQDDALKAIRFGVEMAPAHYNLYVAGAEGSGRAMALRQVLSEVAPKMKTPNDVVAATNFSDYDTPVVLEFAPGQGQNFADAVEGFVEAMKQNLPVALQSGENAQKKQAIMAQVQAAQNKAQGEFDKKIESIKLGKFGVYFAAQPGQDGHLKIAMALKYEGKPLTPQEKDAKIAAGAFTEDEFKQALGELQQRKGGILEAYQAMMQGQLEMMNKVQGMIAQLDEETVVSVVNQLAGELATIATQGPKTAADEAFEQRAQERDAEINEELQKLAQTQFGKFHAAVQAGMDESGKPVVMAVPAVGQLPVNDQIAEKLIAAGKITKAEYEEAKAAIAKKAATIQKKAEEYVAQTQEEQKKLQASKPAPDAGQQKVVSYVQSLANFAASNYKIFMGIKEGGEGIKPMPGSRPLDPEDFFRVSVLTDNSETKGAPVVWETNPTYERVFGTAEGNQRNMVIPGVGVVKTEGVGGPTFKSGSFMKANGGFLVMRAMDVLKNPGVWHALMDAVRTGRAEITEGGFLGLASMKGETYHLPAKVKVVLIGSPMIQMLLEQHDEDFAANFQGVAQFQPTIKITEEAVQGFLGFLKHSVAGSAGQILELTRGAMERILEHAARLADSNKNFTAQFGALHGLLQEATYAAQKAGRSEIRGEDVDSALQAKMDREDVHYKRMSELYQKNVFRVDTSGSAVGQINGLAVMGSHGVQMRITFVAGPGQPGIVSVDHQAGTTGSSFNKALGNEWSFVMNEFGRDAKTGKDKPVRAQIRVSYEQNYGGIDGDSSTSTTLYGLLSALSGVPIKQSIAVTGSADQFGNVQAIGGVNEKIEGFFDLCSHRGLTGEQGVIIPKTNVADLQLKPEVAEAIRQGKFHVWAVDTVAQGMEILTGVAYQTIKDKAAVRLDEIAKVK